MSAAFVQRFDGPVDDLMMPVEHTLADTNIGEVFGVTALPHLRDFTISGPFAVTGVSDTPSRRKIFSCRPTTLRRGDGLRRRHRAQAGGAGLPRAASAPRTSRT